jgi:glucose-1-phosphate thymidylyltransferase
MNLWAFTPGIVDACARIPRSPRGEFELPDAVRYLMRDLGIPVTAGRRCPVIDLSTRADIARVRERVAGIEVRL